MTAEGKATKEVAPCLGVTVKTVETHRRAIMEKLGLHSVAELTKLKGLLDSGVLTHDELDAQKQKILESM